MQIVIIINAMIFISINVSIVNIMNFHYEKHFSEFQIWYYYDHSEDFQLITKNS